MRLRSGLPPCRREPVESDGLSAAHTRRISIHPLGDEILRGYLWDTFSHAPVDARRTGRFVGRGAWRTGVERYPVSLIIVATGCTESDSSSGMTVTVDDLGVDAEQLVDARDMDLVAQDAVRDTSVDAQPDATVDLGLQPDMFIPTACADEIDNDNDA